jgi:hypothetical protein
MQKEVKKNMDNNTSTQKCCAKEKSGDNFTIFTQRARCT